MKLTNPQLADILQASETLVRTALDSDLGTRNLEIKQEYAVAYLTQAMLTQVTLPRDHHDTVVALTQFCAAQELTNHEIRKYLRDPSLAPDTGGRFITWKLIPEDMHQFAAIIIDEFERQGLPLPDGYLAALTHLGYATPARRFNPFVPNYAAHRPREPHCPERQAAAEELRGAPVTSNEQALATMLLLYVIARDQYINLNVIATLSVVKTYLDTVNSRSTREESAVQGLTRLQKHFDGTLKELGLRRQDLIKRPVKPGTNLVYLMLTMAG